MQVQPWYGPDDFGVVEVQTQESGRWNQGIGSSGLEAARGRGRKMKDKQKEGDKREEAIKLVKRGFMMDMR